MTENRNLDDAELDALFAAAADQVVEPSSALMARIVADADLVVAEQVAARFEPRVAERRNWFAGFLKAVGGWPAMGGLVTATAVGIWMGYAPPVVVDDIAGNFWTTDTGFDLADLMPSYEALMNEG